jgi:hypothetical protein
MKHAEVIVYKINARFGKPHTLQACNYLLDEGSKRKEAKRNKLNEGNMDAISLPCKTTTNAIRTTLMIKTSSR